MRQVSVKITIPDDLYPGVQAVAKKLGIPFDTTVQLLMSGCSVPLREQIAEALIILAESKEDQE
ncbi:hypothetical protein ACTQ34_07245 [Agathobaculum sp. LCP25S3_E8]|uniref:hypothetical protein n=1 Tax=Agathobaculum sp. LCP25S3_E8 TaxID=3438735 RepID=UPI003F9334A8